MYSIYDNSKIGANCTIHAGVIIGADGFGFVPNNNKIAKMPQAGKVIILNNVEIGANTTIDKGTLKNTIIEEGVKLDNLIQIGHNVQIGKNTLIAAQCGIAGSTKIGENCMIGGQVAIAEWSTLRGASQLLYRRQMQYHFQFFICKWFTFSTRIQYLSKIALHLVVPHPLDNFILRDVLNKVLS